MTKKPLFQQSPQSSEALDWHHKKLFYPTDYNGYYHWHQGCELLIVFDGAGSVVVNQQMSPIKKGMLFSSSPFNCTMLRLLLPLHMNGPHFISTHCMPKSA